MIGIGLATVRQSEVQLPFEESPRHTKALNAAVLLAPEMWQAFVKDQSSVLAKRMHARSESSLTSLIQKSAHQAMAI